MPWSCITCRSSRPFEQAHRRGPRHRVGAVPGFARGGEFRLIEADIIVVGGGSAGCVLANRLSEDRDCSVLLLEAGDSANGFMFRMPTGAFNLLGNTERDWMSWTEPDPSVNDRVGLWSTGRCLGGGSSINGMIYI